MAQLPCTGLSWPLTKPPFGSCAIYFHYGAHSLKLTCSPLNIDGWKLEDDPFLFEMSLFRVELHSWRLWSFCTPLLFRSHLFDSWKHQAAWDVYKPTCFSDCGFKHTVDGRYPAPPGMYKTLSIIGYLRNQPVSHQPYQVVCRIVAINITIMYFIWKLASVAQRWHRSRKFWVLGRLVGVLVSMTICNRLRSFWRLPGMMFLLGCFSPPQVVTLMNCSINQMDHCTAFPFKTSEPQIFADSGPAQIMNWK